MHGLRWKSENWLGVTSRATTKLGEEMLSGAAFRGYIFGQ
jgi:hypothetical protein